MTTTTVVNIHHRKPYDVRVTRNDAGTLNGAGYFGNPVKLRRDTPVDRIVCLLDFLEYFNHRMGVRYSAKWQREFPFGDAEYIGRVLLLDGKILGCVCKPRHCHADVYAAFLNAGLVGLADLEYQLQNELQRLRGT